MRTSIAIPILLGAGAIAHPHFKLNNPLAHVHHKRDQPFKVITTTIGNQVEIEDFYVATVYGNSPPPAPTTTAAPIVAAAPEKLAVAPVQQPKQEEHQYSAPAPSVTPSITPVAPAPAPVSTSAAPVQSIAPSSGGDDGAPKSGGKSILESANHFRSLMGFPVFTYSSQLDANAAKTNNDDSANHMIHELNSGSMAQCIAEVDNTSGDGTYTPFELTYLAWLCEIPDSRLGSGCDAMKAATHMVLSDTGHAEILRNPQYTKMGCNYLTSTEHHDNFVGEYTCDFA